MSINIGFKISLKEFWINLLEKYSPNYILAYQPTEEICHASKDLDIETKVGICQSKDSFFGEVEPERMPVAPYLNNKWELTP